jgi:hypothetical protein
MRAKHGEVLGHVWSISCVNCDARKFADVELEGVAVQGDVLEGALGERCLSGGRVLDESGRGVLENKPECVL